MTRAWLLAIPFALALATPAAAAYCDDRSDGIAVINGKVSFGIHVGEPYTEEEIAAFDEMALRQQGYDVSRAERWNGCIRAWVRDGDGRQRQQFFDPNDYGPLDLTYKP
jgi:hypothetical protein